MLKRVLAVAMILCLLIPTSTYATSEGQNGVELLDADYESKSETQQLLHTFSASIDIGDFPVPTVVPIRSTCYIKYDEDENGNDILRKTSMFACWEEVTHELSSGASMDVNYITLNGQTLPLQYESTMADPDWVWDTRVSFPDRSFVAQETYVVEGHAILSCPNLLPRIYGVTNAITMHE